MTISTGDRMHRVVIAPERVLVSVNWRNSTSKPLRLYAEIPISLTVFSMIAAIYASSPFAVCVRVPVLVAVRADGERKGLDDVARERSRIMMVGMHW